MDLELDRFVRFRARNRCEYCHRPQAASKLLFPLDHIIARQHGGATVRENLALCCGRCNRHKGPNIAGLDPDTSQLSRLFNPRTDIWPDHFTYRGPLLVGLTPIGRTTVVVLNFNHPESLLARQALIESGTDLS